MNTTHETPDTTERNWGAEEWRAPEVAADETLVFSECGRIIITYGPDARRVDCRSHYFRVIRRHGEYILLVKHGGGTERAPLTFMFPVDALAAMSSDDRYRLLYTLHITTREGIKAGLATAKRRQDAELAAGTLKRHRPRKPANAEQVQR